MTDRTVKSIYFVMLLLGAGCLLFSIPSAILSDCNQYQICDRTLHGTRESVSYVSFDGSDDTIYLGITEDEYKGSMYRVGFRKAITSFNNVPDEFIGPDRAVMVIGDHLMEKYPDDYLRVNAARCLVQRGIDYTHDCDLYGVDEFWARPTETLYHLRGDCEDLTVLFCSICDYMGVSTVIFDNDDHECAGVKVEAYGAYRMCDGEKYYACELTSHSLIGYGRIDGMKMYQNESSFMYYVFSTHISGTQKLCAAVDRWGLF